MNEIFEEFRIEITTLSDRLFTLCGEIEKHCESLEQQPTRLPDLQNVRLLAHHVEDAAYSLEEAKVMTRRPAHDKV